MTAVGGLVLIPAGILQGAAVKFRQYASQVKALSRQVSKSATKGERILGALFPNRGTGFPGGWSQNRLEQVQHLRNWTYVFINCICSKIASLMPNLAMVHDQPIKGRTTKACQRGLSNLMYGAWGGSSHIMEGGHSFLTMGEYRSKALSAVKPHEELEPLELNHELRRLIENPNPVDTSYDFFYEKKMFDLLCGVSYVWLVPNVYGKPCEMWVIPSHWVWPRTGGGRLMDREYFPGGVSHAPKGAYVRPDDPYADRLIHYYEIRPWGGMGSSGVLWLPPDEVVMFRRKSPLNKIDGYSPLEAVAQWIDSEESISASRWAQFQNQARPELAITLGPGYEDPSDPRIKRLEAKIAYKLQGEYNYGKPFVVPPGAKVEPLSFNPTEMAYFQSEEQIRDMLGSAFQVPKTAVGISSDMTYGSVLATLAQLCSGCLNPHLAADGQSFTKYLASRWDEPAGPSWGHGVTLAPPRNSLEAQEVGSGDVAEVDEISRPNITPPSQFNPEDNDQKLSDAGRGGLEVYDNTLNPPADEATGWPPRPIRPQVRWGKDVTSYDKSYKLFHDVYDEGVSRWDNWFKAVGGESEQVWGIVKSEGFSPKEMDGWGTIIEMNRLNRVREEYEFVSKAVTMGQGGRGAVSPARCKMWWDDCVPADPAQVNSDLAEDRASFAITPGEVRALRGRKPYPNGGDDPVVQGGPMGITVIPWNTGEKQDKLAELMKPMTEGQEQGAGGPGGMPGAGGGALGGAPPNPLANDKGGPDRKGGGVNQFDPDAGLGKPKVESPNGAPSKSLVATLREIRKELPL